MNQTSTHIQGSIKAGYSVSIGRAVSVQVELNEIFSGLTCRACQVGDCDHALAVRSVGFYPTQLDLDALWLHQLPKLPVGYAYAVTRSGVGTVRTDLYREPRRYHADGRIGGVDIVTLVAVDSDGRRDELASLYHRRTVRQPDTDTVMYVNEIVVPHASAENVRRLIAEQEGGQQDA